MTYRYKLLATTISTLSFLLAANAHADSVIVALSPNGTAEHKKAEVIQALKFVTEITDLGETSTFMNALTGESICDFNVRESKAYSGAKAKINLNRSCVGKLMQFSKSANQQGRAGALDYWGTLRTLATNYDIDSVDAILIIGDPRYHSDSEAKLSMLGAHVANDSHIKADATQSHYGMAGLEGALNGTPVHFSSERYGWFENTRHKEAVARFQNLSVEYLGGQLVTANQDNAQMFARAKKGLTKPVKQYEAQFSDKLEMLFVGREQYDAAPIHEREVSIQAISTSKLTRARNIEVGVTWSCACDVDIYVRPESRADVLYYGHQRSREGIFRKDYRNASDLLNGLETVSFEAPIDLNKLAIGINFYSGKAGQNVTGEIRLTIDNQTYAHPFTIKASAGNKGKGANIAFKTLKAPSKHWVMMSGKDIVRPYLKTAGQ